MVERIVHLPSKLLMKEIIFKDYSLQCNFLQCGMTAVLPQASQTHDSRNRSNVKLMIYVHISSKTWRPEVRGVTLHIGPLRILALYKASIVWNLKQRWLKSRNEIKCYFFLIILRNFSYLAWFLLSIRPISSFFLQVFVKAATNTWKAPKNDEIGQMDNRNQARQEKFPNIIQKSSISFHCVILSIVVM